MLSTLTAPSETSSDAIRANFEDNHAKIEGRDWCDFHPFLPNVSDFILEVKSASTNR